MGTTAQAALGILGGAGDAVESGYRFSFTLHPSRWLARNPNNGSSKVFCLILFYYSSSLPGPDSILLTSADPLHQRLVNSSQVARQLLRFSLLEQNRIGPCSLVATIFTPVRRPCYPDTSKLSDFSVLPPSTSTTTGPFHRPLLGHDALNTIYMTSLACSATVLCSLLLPPLDARPLSMATGPDTLDTRIQIPVVAISEATDFLQHAWGSLAASTLSISSIHNRPSLRPLYFVHAWTVGHSLELPKASELGQIRIEDGKLRGCR